MTPRELMADIKDGLYVTDLFGQGVSLITATTAAARPVSGSRMASASIR